MRALRAADPIHPDTQTPSSISYLAMRCRCHPSRSSNRPHYSVAAAAAATAGNKTRRAFCVRSAAPSTTRRVRLRALPSCTGAAAAGSLLCESQRGRAAGRTRRAARVRRRCRPLVREDAAASRCSHGHVRRTWVHTIPGLLPPERRGRSGSGGALCRCASARTRHRS